MGKIKRGRRKLHVQAVKSDQREKNDSLRTNETDLLPAIFPSAGLFKSTAKHAGSGTEEEKSKGGKDGSSQDNKLTSKKDRRKERHERFLRKLHVSKLVEEKSKKAEQRAKTVIVGDMEPLLSALPTVTLPTTVTKNRTSSAKNAEATPSRQTTGSSIKTKMSQRKRHKIQVSEIEQFKKVLDHPLYKANPMGAISEHIKNVIQRQQEGGT